MKAAEARNASRKLNNLRSKYGIEVLADWGYLPTTSRRWRAGTWTKAELDSLIEAISIMAEALGGIRHFVQRLGRVSVKKSEMGGHQGEALAHQVNLTSKGTFTAWTVVHEFAHAWDGNNHWRLSRALERYTGGRTSPIIARVKRFLIRADLGKTGYENKVGCRGRLPGCNAAGYIYGDKPSGSNWRFNRKEDFAESVAMYVAWGSSGELSRVARGRIERYLLPNGARDSNGVADNWADYAKYFYPRNGDYGKTRRWLFIHELVEMGSPL